MIVAPLLSVCSFRTQFKTETGRFSRSTMRQGEVGSKTRWDLPSSLVVPEKAQPVGASARHIPPHCCLARASLTPLGSLSHPDRGPLHSSASPSPSAIYAVPRFASPFPLRRFIFNQFSLDTAPPGCGMLL